MSHKNYTTAQLEPIMQQLKDMFPVGSTAKHISWNGKRIKEVKIRNHNKFKIVNDPNFPMQGVCYGSLFFWACGEYCVEVK
jgi:hypothetical protein